jgi:two-component system, OmpR family, sensor kinase
LTTATKRLWFLLPAGLGLAGVMLVIRVSLIDSTLFFSKDLDVLIILFGLSLAIFAAVVLILTVVIERLRQYSVERARQATLAEHHRFLRRLDHELKNPLTALRAGLGSLALTLEDENQRQIVRTLETEAQRLSKLVSDLRKLAELDTLPLDVRAIDIRAFIGDVMDIERERIDLDERLLSLNLPAHVDDLPALIGDQDLLLLAVHNLLDNAIKYTRANDTICLEVLRDQEDLLLIVKDTGFGIDYDELPMVWEELYQGRNAENIPGNGIGLALVKAIVERHFGQVNLQSQPGQGTTVTLRLPLT